MDYSRDFDIDLKEGEEGELLVKELALGNRKIEVKRDFMVSRTGNLAIELESRGKASGLAITTAEWWAFVLDGPVFNGEVLLFIKTDRLKKIVDNIKTEKGTIRGGDNNTSELVLVPVQELASKELQYA